MNFSSKKNKIGWVLLANRNALYLIAMQCEACQVEVHKIFDQKAHFPNNVFIPQETFVAQSNQFHCLGAVFTGSGVHGNYFATKACNRFSWYFDKVQKELTPDTLVAKVSQLFTSINKKLLNEYAYDCFIAKENGSTAAIALLYGRTLYLINCGNYYAIDTADNKQYATENNKKNDSIISASSFTPDLIETFGYTFLYNQNQTTCMPKIRQIHLSPGISTIILGSEDLQQFAQSLENHVAEHQKYSQKTTTAIVIKIDVPSEAHLQTKYIYITGGTVLAGSLTAFLIYCYKRGKAHKKP